MSNDDSELPDESTWVAEQREVVLEYLQRQDVPHGEVCEWPAWHLLPYLAIWVIESSSTPGRVGWWVISGDVPTDYVSFDDADHPRVVVRHFGQCWMEMSNFMLRGERHPKANIGTPDQWPKLGDLLHRKAAFLQRLAADDPVWNEQGN